MVYRASVYRVGHFLRDVLTHRMQRSFAVLGDGLLPARCACCGAAGRTATGKRLDLCAQCLALLPFNLHACQQCALPLPGDTDSLICGRCLRRTPPYQRSYCAFEYAYPVHHLIRRMKYGHSLATTRVLGHLLGQYLIDHHVDAWPECIIPVPLHTHRYRDRGYNQVIEIGRHLEAMLNIPMRTDLVQRIRMTPEQAGLTRKQRRINLRRAFLTTTVAMPSHIALLDDVITTGSTAQELTETLLAAGISCVEVWGVARANVRVTTSK